VLAADGSLLLVAVPDVFRLAMIPLITILGIPEQKSGETKSGKKSPKFNNY